MHENKSCDFQQQPKREKNERFAEKCEALYCNCSCDCDCFNTSKQTMYVVWICLCESQDMLAYWCLSYGAQTKLYWIQRNHKMRSCVRASFLLDIVFLFLHTQYQSVSTIHTHTLTNSNEHFYHTQTEPNETSIFSWFAAAITAKRAVTEHFYAKSSQTTRKNSFLKMAASVW